MKRLIVFAVLGAMIVGSAICCAPVEAPRQTRPLATKPAPALDKASAARPIVAIIKGTDVDQMVADGVKLVGGYNVKSGQKVVIKPNLTFIMEDDGPRPGVTTDVRIVKALISQVRKAAPCSVTVAEGSGGDTWPIFDAYGYTALSQAMDFDLVDLNRDKRVKVAIDGMVDKEYMMPRTIMQADYIISVPIMKTHELAGVTLGIKNWFGLLPLPRSGWHDRLHETLCDAISMRKPDLVVVDGLVGMEGRGPLSGQAVKMDIIVVGTDVVAVDAVCSTIMGFDPRKIDHIRFSYEKKLGEIDLSKIDLRGEPIDSVKRKFKPAR